MPDSENRISDGAYDYARYVKATLQHPDGRIDGEAFMLRPAESYLSVHCLEFCDGESMPDRLEALREVFRDSSFNVKKTGLFAVVNGGQVVRDVRVNSTDRRELWFQREIDDGGETHCGLHGYSYEDDVIADLVAETVNGVVSAYDRD